MKCSNAHGLSFTFLDNGSIRCIDMDPIRISLKPASPFSYAGSNIYLRKHKPSISCLTLLGPSSNNRFTIHDNQFIAKGEWEGVGYECSLRLSEKSCSWQWNIALTNHSDETAVLDLILVQDVGLKSITSGLINEYYVSHYLERRILHDPIKGPVICCRQNMKEPTGNPWLMIACDNGAVPPPQMEWISMEKVTVRQAFLKDFTGINYQENRPVNHPSWHFRKDLLLLQGMAGNTKAGFTQQP